MDDAVVIRPKSWFAQPQTRWILIGLLPLLAVLQVTTHVLPLWLWGAMSVMISVAATASSGFVQRLEAREGEIAWISGRSRRVVSDAGGAIVAASVVPAGGRTPLSSRVIVPVHGKPILLTEVHWRVDAIDGAVQESGVERRLESAPLSAAQLKERYRGVPTFRVLRVGKFNTEPAFWVVAAACAAFGIAGARIY